MRFEFRFAAVVLFFASAFTSIVAAQSVQAVASSARIHGQVDTTQTVALSNHVPEYAKSALLPASAIAPDAEFSGLTLVLKRAPQVEAAFDQLLQEQVTPGSPRYHQWLLPAQVGALYGPAPADVDAATAWLRAQGLMVTDVAPNRLFIHFRGSAQAVASAFQTSFKIFALANGESRYSITREPSVPAALAPLVDSIAGLSQAIHYSTARKGALLPARQAANEPVPMLNSSAGNHYLVSGDFAVAYDINSVYGAGFDGTGEHIAIAGESRVDATDISTLQGIEALPAKQPVVYIPPTGVDPGTPGDTSGTDNGFQDEATLDVNRTNGTAPGATLDLVVSADVGAANTYATQGLYIAINYAIATLNDPILTVSFGGCENLNGASNTNYESSIFQTAASQGITTFISAGDSGAAGCNAFDNGTIPANQVLSINDLCAGPYVTCLGGTEFNDSANASTYWAATNGTGGVSLKSYIPEGVWNDVSITNGVYSYGAGGGGSSVYIARPSWQTGTGVPAGNFRLVPDVSLTSSTHDGYVTCLKYLGATCGPFYSFGGTSAAAPSMAGIQALADQKLGGRQGNINPTIYSLAATNANVYHDVTVASSGVSNCTANVESLCNNSTPSQTSATGLAGYTVNGGYDEATGWGSVDTANYIAAISTVATGSFSVSASPTSLSFSSGATTGNTSSVSVASVSGFAGTVSLSCSLTGSSATYQPTCSVSPTSVTLASGGTATLTISSATPHAVPVSGQASLGWRSAGGAVFAMLLCCVPFRRRRAFSTLAALCLLAIGLVSMSGCGGGGTPSTPLGSSAGQYTVTITATSAGATTQTATVAVTIH